MGAWVRAWVRESQFISGTAEHIFLKFCPKLEKKKENFAQGPIFDKKWLKITILISAYRRILSSTCFKEILRKMGIIYFFMKN